MKTVFFFPDFSATFFEEIFSFEAVFIFVSWVHGIKKKNRGSGGQPLEDPYCPLRSLCRLPKGKTKMTQKGQKQKRP